MRYLYLVLLLFSTGCGELGTVASGVAETIQTFDDFGDFDLNLCDRDLKLGGQWRGTVTSSTANIKGTIDFNVRQKSEECALQGAMSFLPCFLAAVATGRIGLGGGYLIAQRGGNELKIYYDTQPGSNNLDSKFELKTRGVRGCPASVNGTASFVRIG